MKNSLSLWRDICDRFALQSQCQSRQVGCIIVNEDRIIGQGYNGAPVHSDCENCMRCKNKAPIGQKLDIAICTHAESNAIGYCARHGISTRGATLYTTLTPCVECAKLIITAGIVEVISFNTYDNIDQIAITTELFKNASVKHRIYG